MTKPWSRGVARRVTGVAHARSAVSARHSVRLLSLTPLLLPHTALCTQVRACHAGPGGGGGEYAPEKSHADEARGRRGGGGDDARASASPSSSAFEQFQNQRNAYHKHSFHEKGSTHHKQQQQQQQHHRNDQEHHQQQHGARSDADDNADSGYGGPQAGRNRAEEFARSSEGASTSATAQERREMSRNWENAFFGRVHYEDGMHDRFQQAVNAEEHERVASKHNDELFPDWAPDEEAPLLAFKRLSPALQLRYILNRLSMGERRVRYAPDYGSLSMMYQLNLGEMMVREAEGLLDEMGWMNDELRQKIDDVKMMATKVKYDYDLD